jgi:protein ImuB
MARRYVSIWFRQLKTDWFIIRQPQLCHIPFVLSAPSHGRMLITDVNFLAQQQGICTGMPVADARAIVPSLQVLDDIPDLPGKLLNRLAEFCIRFTPCAAIDPPDGLLLDVSGCTHLWGGDSFYLEEINKRLAARGYQLRSGMADSIGTAWGVARFGKESLIINPGANREALLSLPAAALRLEMETGERLNKLGLRYIKDFLYMPHTALRRRFGPFFIQRLNQALGYEEEVIQPVLPIEPWQERLPCLEPLSTATGIAIALQRLLATICHRLQQEQKGLRSACLKAYRTDGEIIKTEIGTNRPSHNVIHLFKLFENKIANIAPGPGIELFILEALHVEDALPKQENLWKQDAGLEDTKLSELLDRLAGRIGAANIHRYVPDQHYWPERSVKLACALDEKAPVNWKIDHPRPLQLLSKPEPIEVTAPIPDYPPMLFRYKGKLHKIMKADGPERIEQEWWIQEGRHRDYYSVEDEAGNRYWLFRSGHYTAEKTYQWFLHGFFA